MRDLPVAGLGGVPANGATAVVLNVTVTNPTQASYLTVFPAGGAPPDASDLNFTAGETVPNRVIVPLGTGAEAGKISVYSPVGSVDVIVDVNGWYGDGVAQAAGALFTPMAPTRVYDSRNGAGPLGQGQARAIPVAGLGGVPADASAVVLNATVTNPTQASYLEAYPAGGQQPLASDLNFVAGETVPNLVVVRVGAGGMVDAFNALGTTDVIFDVVGYYR